MMKVMIADDEEKVCQLIFTLIDWKALEMEVAGVVNNGIEALEFIKAYKPDLIITDIRMPGYDGLEMIHRAKQIHENMDVIIISGYRHFEYAQNAIKYGVSDYLLKPIKKDEFLKTLHKMKEKYKQRTEQLSNEEKMKIRLKSDRDKLRGSLFSERLLIKDKDADNASMEQLNETYHYQFQVGLFQIIAVKIDCSQDEAYKNGIQVVREKIIDILHKGLTDECFELELYPDESLVYCLLNYKDEDSRRIRRQLKVILDEMVMQREVFPQFEFTIGVGERATGIEGLRESCQSAVLALDQRIIDGTGVILERLDVVEAGNQKETLLVELNRKMNSALEVLDIKGVLSCIEDLKEQVCRISNSGQEIMGITREAYNLHNILIRNYYLTGDNQEELYEKFIQSTNRCYTVNQLFECLINEIKSSVEGIIEAKKQSDTKPIRVAKKYIQENYMNSITLDEVAKVAGFNSSYFSTLFKKECGINFLEYLSEVRMNKAKDLLRESDNSIAVICEQVGYSDIKHFTRGFKKATGIKPNEYRKLYS